MPSNSLQFHLPQARKYIEYFEEKRNITVNLQRKSHQKYNNSNGTSQIKVLTNDYFTHDNSMRNDKNSRLLVAVCTLSRSTQSWKNFKQSDLYRFFLKSVYETTRESFRTYDIALHVGVNDNDHFFVNRTDEAMLVAAHEFEMNLTFYKYKITEPDTLPMNSLMQDAANTGAHYLVRLNDDTEIMTKGWISYAVAKLRSFSPPNIGVVGPICKQGNTRILTHDMVHRKHLDIFGSYYPKILKNWYIDDWISTVYGPSRTSKLMNWVVIHHVEGGTRYTPTQLQRKLLKPLIAQGEQRIRNYLHTVYAFSVDITQFGVVLVDIRKPMEKLSFRILKLLRQIIRTQPNLKCEVWTSPYSIISTEFQDFIHLHTENINIRHMPAKFTSSIDGNSIDLLGKHGGHIGKAMALRESKFRFPVLFDGDSWPCNGWLDIVLNASHTSDIIWSLAPIPFGASNNRDASACTNPYTLDQISKYKLFPERNTGTILAVRRTAMTYAWLTDVLIIRADMSRKIHRKKFPPFQDQAAFREAFFLHRHHIREHIIPSNVACRQPTKFSQNCVSCLCQCSSCIFVHGKSLFNQCDVSDKLNAWEVKTTHMDMGLNNLHRSANTIDNTDHVVASRTITPLIDGARIPPESTRGLPALNSTTDGVCGKLLGHGLTDIIAHSPNPFAAFSHERLAQDMEASPQDLMHIYMPMTIPCSGYEVWAQTLLIYRECRLRKKNMPTACPFLDTARFTQNLIKSSKLEESMAQKECAKLKLYPCTFYSQMGEDVTVFNMFFKNQKGGTYLEMGALDGVQFSNTLFLEETLDWKGVLIEPGVKYDQLVQNRGTNGRNTLHKLAVCNTPGDVTLTYLPGIEAEGGLDKPTRVDSAKYKQILTETIKCDTLGNILKASGVVHIDLFSLDVEGRELEVLQSMDWNVSFNVLVMERNKNHAEIEALLMLKGYQYVREQRGNVIWALRTFRPVMDGEVESSTNASRGKIIHKTIFSNKKRFIFVAGLEGTGHHFIGTIFRESDHFKVLNSDPIRCNLMQIGSETQLFDLTPDSSAYNDKKKLIITQLRRLELENSPFSLFALNTDQESGKNCMSGMMSYPNGLNGKSWPDIYALSRVAEEAGVDLRIIVLTRKTVPMIQSVSARFRSEKPNSILAERGANKLVRQLDQIDHAFYTCISYEDLHGLVNDSLRNIQKFLVPIEHQLHYDFIAAVRSKVHNKRDLFRGVNYSKIGKADDANHRLMQKCDFIS